MTRGDFKMWAEAHNCEVETIEGINLTGSSLRIVFKPFPKYYTYLDLPLDREMPDNMVRKACELLNIPDCTKPPDKQEAKSEKK